MSTLCQASRPGEETKPVHQGDSEQSAGYCGPGSQGKGQRRSGHVRLHFVVMCVVTVMCTLGTKQLGQDYLLVILL